MLKHLNPLLSPDLPILQSVLLFPGQRSSAATGPSPSREETDHNRS